VLAIIAFLIFKPTSEGPSYGGHALSYWVAMLGAAPDIRGSDYQKATNAIDHIGVAALPFLVKWVHNDPPRWKAILGLLLDRISFQSAQRLSARMVMEGKGRQLAEGTYESYRVLGKRALPALDDLCRLMDDADKHDPLTVIQVTMDLSCFGTNALPALLAAATNSDHPAWPQALDAIGMMSDLGDATQPTVMAIITTCLSDPIRQESGVFALGNIKAVPQISIPAIAPFLQSTNAHLRGNSAAALGKFGAQARSVIPALTNALADADPYVHACAAEALHNIDPAMFPSGPSK
jgi:HEAT repeat protein